MSKLNLEKLKTIEINPGILQAIFVTMSDDDLNFLKACNFFGSDITLHDVLFTKWPMFFINDTLLANDVTGFHYTDETNWILNIDQGHSENTIECNSMFVDTTVRLKSKTTESKIKYLMTRPWMRTLSQPDNEMRIAHSYTNIIGEVYVNNNLPVCFPEGEMVHTIQHYHLTKNVDFNSGDLRNISVVEMDHKKDIVRNDIIQAYKGVGPDNQDCYHVTSKEKMETFNSCGLPVFTSGHSHFSRFNEYCEFGRLNKSTTMTATGVKVNLYSYVVDENENVLSALVNTEGPGAKARLKFELPL